LTISRAVTVFARLSIPEAQLLKQISESRGEAVSTFIRRSVRAEFGRLGFLTSYENQALGLTTENLSANEMAKGEEN
jgi:hypothetical protein